MAIIHQEITEAIELMQWFCDSLPEGSLLIDMLDGMPEYCRKNLQEGCMFPATGYERKFYEGYEKQLEAEKKLREAWDVMSKLRDENKQLSQEVEKLRPLKDKVALLEEELTYIKLRTYHFLLSETA